MKWLKTMFAETTYRRRREALRAHVHGGLVLLLGNQDSPINYQDNLYPFRQDSTFLYYVGISRPALTALIDVDENRDAVFGDELSLEAAVWSGLQPSLNQLCRKSGIGNIGSSRDLATVLRKASRNGRKIHYLPPYRTASTLKLHQLLSIPLVEIRRQSSPSLIRAVVAQRSVKSDEEIEQIEAALTTSYAMHVRAMQLTCAGAYEMEVVSAMQSMAYALSGVRMAYPPVFTVRGDILHNQFQGNCMQAGELALNDSGAESAMGYASDITRTIPVSGRFSNRQREIYQIVLSTQRHAIRAIRPGTPYRDIHLSACVELAQGLIDIGLMKGDAREAVASGAHALFFPHGVGHMLGLDVHDMESLGEDNVGYTPALKRSRQFGLRHLRLAKSLEPGFVVTVEPGIYFIAPLIERWQKEKRCDAFIDWRALSRYKGFGGVRIEDDVQVTTGGCRQLGKPIPKTVDQVEQLAGSG